jgi:hypothetical protein
LLTKSTPPAVVSNPITAALFCATRLAGLVVDRDDTRAERHAAATADPLQAHRRARIRIIQIADVEAAASLE